MEESDLLTVQGGLRTRLQGLAVPDHTLTIVAGEFEILRQLECVGRTSIFAQTAKHTAAQVIGKVNQFLAASLFIALAGHHDQVLGTSQSAQIARNAE